MFCGRLLTFQKYYFMNTIRVPNRLDLDQDQHSVSVGPDLGPKCLQRLSAEDNGWRYQVKS